jgi:hypothetical protein
VKENRKQAVSIRLGASDIRKVKRLAERLGVRDSDVIRFALKWALNRVAPLCDPEIRGPSLVPMFVETGAELIRHFELDAARLDAIVNDGVDDERAVAHDDIALLALAGSQQPYALLSLRQTGGYGGAAAPQDSIEALRQHLYDKYVYGRGEQRGREPALPGETAEASGTVIALVAG